MPAYLTAQANQYEIKEILGESSTSLVYLAHRIDKTLTFKQQVILKVFKNLTPNEDLKLPVLQMESLLRARHSSHLVKVLGFERIQNQLALVLEYISGLNLKQLLQKTHLSIDEKYYICAQTLRGLEELKQNGLVHGDLSLSNILIDTKGKVYLTDYGLANYAGKHIYSTKPFTAPELSQNKNSSFQSDLFSLGVLEKLLINADILKNLEQLENHHFFVTNDPLLDPHPQKRIKKSFSFGLSTPFSLGEKVNQIISFKNSLHSSQTVSFFQKKYNALSNLQKICFTGLFIFTLLASNPFISFGKVFHDKKNRAAHILIRTQQWMYIQIADKSGYSPIAATVDQPGMYQIKWKNQLSQGTKYIQVQAGEKVILRDNDFL